MHLGTPTVFSWAILLTSTLAIGYGIGRTATALDRPVPWVVSGHTPGVAEVTLPLRAQIPLTPTTAIHGSLKSRLQETDNDLMPEHNYTAALRRNSARSQHNEDAWLYDTAFFKQTNGLFLEMGALTGNFISNTWWFAQNANWTGVLIEVSPGRFKTLVESRQESICINAAVCEDFQEVHYADKPTAPQGGSESAGIWEFMDEDRKASWLADARFEQKSLRPVLCVPLMYILDRLNIYHFDFWSLDVEGAELEVLRTVDFKRLSVSVIVVERNQRFTQVSDLLVKNGYADMHPTFPGSGRNGFFVHQDYLGKLRRRPSSLKF